MFPNATIAAQKEMKGNDELISNLQIIVNKPIMHCDFEVETTCSNDNEPQTYIAHKNNRPKLILIDSASPYSQSLTIACNNEYLYDSESNHSFPSCDQTYGNYSDCSNDQDRPYIEVVTPPPPLLNADDCDIETCNNNSSYYPHSIIQNHESYYYGSESDYDCENNDLYYQTGLDMPSLELAVSHNSCSSLQETTSISSPTIEIEKKQQKQAHTSLFDLCNALTPLAASISLDCDDCDDFEIPAADATNDDPAIQRTVTENKTFDFSVNKVNQCGKFMDSYIELHLSMLSQIVVSDDDYI